MRFLNDTFTEAQDTLLQDHTPEKGGAWSKHPSFGTNATVEAAGGRIVGSSLTAASVYVNGADPGSADHYVEAPFRLAAIDANNIPGLLVRVSLEAFTCYQCFISPTSGNELQLQRTSSGSSISLGTFNLDPVIDTDYLVRLQAVGSAIKVFVNGVERISAENEDIASGLVGLRVRGGATMTFIRAGNFIAAPVSGRTIYGGLLVRPGRLLAR